MTATAEKTTGATKKEILSLCREQGVAFLRLQFTDILGVNKNFEVPESQFDKALSGDIRFDGSAIEGFVRIEESDMVLKPDLDTFRVLPSDEPGGWRGCCATSTTPMAPPSPAAPGRPSSGRSRGLRRSATK